MDISSFFLLLVQVGNIKIHVQKSPSTVIRDRGLVNTKDAVIQIIFADGHYNDQCLLVVTARPFVQMTIRTANLWFQLVLLQRDDECAGKNAICLNNTCFIKGAPLGGQCGADKTTYASLDAEQETIQQTIIRDNCTLGTYCNIPTGLCIESKPNGQYCEQDRECLSGTCSNDYVCINGPEVFHTIKPWLWGVLGAAVVIFVLVILGALWILHRYQSKKEHAKIMAFFGDNEEFAKYVDHDENTSVYENDQFVNDSRTSVVYLTTPDYVKSSALSTSSWRNSSAAKLREASPRTSGSFTPSGNRTLTPEPR
ncbi:hypothetical protein EC973_002031 [Apophysomyces ossiformis]|uniref:Uncharacterized protein n=1 Tax=Apophysomyces ossiformis TaxID=679940 RepID=A0A8H7EM02_9FUNG|nr:hypothetical protein EC973_002031 [Apophysomyces ossiformis]